MLLVFGYLVRVGGCFDIQYFSAEWLSLLFDDVFYVVSVMEVFCYLFDFVFGIVEVVRVFWFGGFLFCLVELGIGLLDFLYFYMWVEIEEVFL